LSFDENTGSRGKPKECPSRVVDNDADVGIGEKKTQDRKLPRKQPILLKLPLETRQRLTNWPTVILRYD